MVFFVLLFVIAEWYSVIGNCGLTRDNIVLSIINSLFLLELDFSIFIVYNSIMRTYLEPLSPTKQQQYTFNSIQFHRRLIFLVALTKPKGFCKGTKYIDRYSQRRTSYTDKHRSWSMLNHTINKWLKFIQITRIKPTEISPNYLPYFTSETD